MRSRAFNNVQSHCPWTLENDAWKSLLRLRMDTCRLVAQKRTNKRTKDTEGDQLNANHVKHHQTTVDSFTSFHKVFMWNWCGFHCPCSATIVHTQWRLIRTFIHAWRSLRQRSCWHACHKMKMVKQDSINIYNRWSCLIPSFKTWLSTLNQRKLNKKDTKKVDFFRNRRKQHHCEKNAWQSLLFCFSRQHASKNTQCKCQDCQANVKHAIILLHFVMWPSSIDIFCRYPSAEGCKKQHSTRFHCTVSDIDSATTHNQDSWQWKGHTWGSMRRFLLACLPPIRQFMENFCMSLCNICHLIHRTTESQKRN